MEEGVIISRGGQPPPLWERWARKDVYRVGPEDDSSTQVSFAIRFREFAGMFVSHCHNTAHEDAAMMQRFDVEDQWGLYFATPQPSWEGCSYRRSYAWQDLTQLPAPPGAVAASAKRIRASTSAAIAASDVSSSAFTCASRPVKYSCVSRFMSGRSETAPRWRLRWYSSQDFRM